MPATAYRQVNEEILQAVRMPSRRYLGLLALLAGGMGWAALCFAYQVMTGMGVTGLNLPVGWGTYITSFVFWIGIGHAGTLISAILYLLRVEWRTAVARAAETMTVFAVMTAGLFPLIHLGRVWVVYFILPYPNTAHLWPNFRSPLVFDVVAITTYLTISVLFWYLGLIPDLAAVRDASTGRKRWVYGVLSVGWQGANDQWRHYLRAYACFAALATPLVISVHSVVSWDFAVGIVPGWHETIFPPYFVAGAIHSGLAMVLTLLIPLRSVLRLKAVIQPRHLEEVAKLIIVTGLMMLYAYAVEPFMAWYGGDLVERQSVVLRATGPYAPYFWTMTALNAVLPLALFRKRVRTSLVALFAIGLLINVGMWLERYVIIVGSLANDFMPSAWFTYRPSWVELSIAVGAGCFFLFMLLVTLRVIPAVAVSESKPEPRLAEESAG
ncbi:MAG: hydrogenase [Armatimonadetes bacterium]|nr:hydrogenase [Armatimonadota bacterium]